MEPTTDARDTQIVCDMTNAPDTAEERVGEYRRLFAEALIGREKTAQGIRFRFRAAPGIEAWVRDLAAREQACCSFYGFTVTTDGDQVLWDATVVDDDLARVLLAEFYALPDTIGPDAETETVIGRFTGLGLRVIAGPSAPSA